MTKLSPTYTRPFKRRNEGKTDYSKRLKLLASKKPRLAVRRSLNYLTASIVEFSERGDKTIVSVSSMKLKKLGWNYSTDNIPASYLLGLMIGKEAIKKKISEAILDSGLHISTKGNRIYAVAKGARDSGLKIEVDEKMMPSEERIKGTHISSYIEKFRNLPDDFEKMKAKIGG